MKRLSQRELLLKYGDPTKRATQKKIKWVRLPTEACITPAMLTVAVHESIAEKFVDAYYGTCRTLDEFPKRVDGLNVRKVAGTENWSLHSWGLAWDVFLPGSPRIDPASRLAIPSKEWFSEMQRRGFFAGQNFKRPDLHHVEYPW